jgi:hypothetical protein
MTLVYIGSSVPTDAERAAAPDGAAYRNASYWTGHVERASAVYADSEAIRAAYREAGIEAQPLTSGESEQIGESSEYELESRGRWWYVVGPDGDVNETGMSRDEAEVLMQEVQRDG